MQTFIFTVRTDQGPQVCQVQRGVIVETSSLLLPIGRRPHLIYVLHKTRSRECLSLGQLIQRLRQDEPAYEKRLFDLGTLLLSDGEWEYAVFDVELQDLDPVPVDERSQSGTTLPPPDPELPSEPIRSNPFNLVPSAPPPASESEAPETIRPGRHSFLVDPGPRITEAVREHVASDELAVETAVVRSPGRLSPPLIPTGTGASGQYPVDRSRFSSPPLTSRELPSYKKRDRSPEADETVPSPPPFRGDDLTPAETPAARRATPMAPRVSGVPFPEGYIPLSERKNGQS